MRVLVTGGLGYIGAHVVRALDAAGHEPLLLDDARRSAERRRGRFRLEKIPLEDTRRVLEVFAGFRPDAVIHLAGYISVAESVRSPELYWRNNLGAAASLLVACACHPVRAFLFSSTAAVYGAVSDAPLREDRELAPASPYGASKLAFERLLHATGEALGFASVALRYFNAAGAVPEWGVGEEHDPEEHLVPRVVRAVLDGRKAQVYGNDYPTRDGTCVRDYVHVLDLAEVHVLGIEAADRLGGKSWNVGTGRGHTVLEVIEAVGASLGKKPEVEILPRRPGDPPTLVADPAALERTLGWKCSHSSLEEIVSSAAEWERCRRAAG
ncbi:MAG: UDP-glucose 4-epimerase GalE [Candidatus Binatia bacterium]|nr:MAG: UDP-glucose 4-epimerase GalE [Candidatus Binatia bacterium]